MKTLAMMLVVPLATLASHGAGADACRCGTRLVTDGDPANKVEALCGPPTSIQHREILRQRTECYYSRLYHSGTVPVPLLVEYRPCNLGSNKPMKRLTMIRGPGQPC